MTSPPEPPPSRRDPLDFDEMIAVIVAFTAIGTILWWGLSRGTQFALPGFDSPSPSALGDPTEAFLGLPMDDGAEDEELPTVASEGDPLRSPQPVPTPTFDRSANLSRRTVDSAIVPSPAIAPPSAGAVRPAIAFVDVPDAYWAAPFISALSQRGIVSGVSSDRFDPDRVITRAELAQTLQQAFDLPTEATPLAFTDIPAGYWATSAIQNATRAEFMSGYPGNIFRPSQPVTRLEALVSLASGLELETPADVEQTLQTYSDREDIPNWADNQIATATAGGLVASDTNPNQLEPDAPATRAEVAVMIYQALVESGQVEAIASENVVQP